LREKIPPPPHISINIEEFFTEYMAVIFRTVKTIKTIACAFLLCVKATSSDRHKDSALTSFDVQFSPSKSRDTVPLNVKVMYPPEGSVPVDLPSKQEEYLWS